MRKRSTWTIILLILLFTNKETYGQKIERVNLTVNFGSAYNFPTYLKIHQNGYKDIIINGAKFRTEGFVEPVYWDYNLDFETNKHFFGLRSTHHKLILKNPPPDIEYFDITHGYNFLIAYYGWKLKYFHLLVGGGIAFSHPEGIVRNSNVALDDGISLIGGVYRLTAPNIEVATLRKIYFHKRFYFNAEIRFTAGYSKPKIINGYAETYPISLHGLFGLGYDFIHKK